MFGVETIDVESDFEGFLFLFTKRDMKYRARSFCEKRSDTGWSICFTRFSIVREKMESACAKRAMKGKACACCGAIIPHV